MKNVTDGVDFTDGNWHACTLGHFIGLLVDAGHDPAVAFRVIEDGPSDEDGKFVRTVEVVMYPDGYVGEGCLGCHSVHKVLRALLEAGVIT